MFVDRERHMHVLQLHDALDHQPGGDQQAARNRQLGDDQTAAETAEPRACRRSAVVLQRRSRADSRGVQRRQRAREYAGEHNHPHDKKHHAVIEIERDPERRRIGRQRLNEPTHPRTLKADANDASGGGQYQHFGQVLPDDPISARRPAPSALPPLAV